MMAIWCLISSSSATKPADDQVGGNGRHHGYVMSLDDHVLDRGLLNSKEDHHRHHQKKKKINHSPIVF